MSNRQPKKAESPFKAIQQLFGFNSQQDNSSQPNLLTRLKYELFIALTPKEFQTLYHQLQNHFAKQTYSRKTTLIIEFSSSNQSITATLLNHNMVFIIPRSISHVNDATFTKRFQKLTPADQTFVKIAIQKAIDHHAKNQKSQ